MVSRHAALSSGDIRRVLEPRRLVHRAGSRAIVVEQEASWGPEGAVQAGDYQILRSVFVVPGHRDALEVIIPTPQVATLNGRRTVAFR